MSLYIYVGLDADKREWSFDHEQEETAAKEIIKSLFLAFNHSSSPYAVIANLHDPNADMVAITERGIGIIELKHKYGPITIKPNGTWFAGPSLIKAGVYSDPHKQVQTYANSIRNKILPFILPKELETSQNEFKFQTTVCFTHPDAKVDDIKELVRRRYRPRMGLLFSWEEFSVLTPREMPDWVEALRFGEDLGGRKRGKPYRLSPETIDHIAALVLGATKWTEIEKLMPTGQPYAYLTLIKEGQRSQFFGLSREEITIGREPNCDVPIPSHYNKVSRKHARIIRIAGDVFLEDGTGATPSAHGTFVNRIKITAPTKLTQGVFLALGSESANDDQTCELEFSFVSPEVPPTTM